MLDVKHVTTTRGRTDRGRNRESSNKHSILTLQGCNRVTVKLEALFQLFSGKSMSVISMLAIVAMQCGKIKNLL